MREESYEYRLGLKAQAKRDLFKQIEEFSHEELKAMIHDYKNKVKKEMYSRINGTLTKLEKSNFFINRLNILINLFKPRPVMNITDELSIENMYSLGWIFNEDSNRYEMEKKNIINYRYFYLYHRPGDKIYKSIITIYLNGTSQSDVNVYKININTLTELKTLLKQLNID